MSIVIYIIRYKVNKVIKNICRIKLIKEFRLSQTLATEYVRTTAKIPLKYHKIVNDTIRKNLSSPKENQMKKLLKQIEEYFNYLHDRYNNGYYVRSDK